MTEVFIIQNHDQAYLGKHGDWIDGSEANHLFRSLHKDEAINMKVEQSVRNPQLRLSVIPCQLNEKGQLQLTATEASPTIDSATEVLFNADQQQSENSEHPLIDSESTTTS